MRAPVLRLAIPALVLLTAVGPPAPARISCNPGPYVVFFDWNDAHLDREAREVQDIPAENQGLCGGSKTMIAGHTDTSEPAGLARKRIDVVLEYLAARGTPRPDIVTRTFGATRLRIPTARGAKERQNRRVEITYRP